MRSFGKARVLLAFLLAAACARDPGKTAEGISDVGPIPAASDSSTPAEPSCDDWGSWNFFALASAALVEECLEGGVDPRAPVGHAPALYPAARTTTDPEVIVLLADAGADPNTRLRERLRRDGRPGYTPLHAAAESNPTPGIVEALVAAGAEVNARDEDELTPLHLAWANDRAIVEELLLFGADPLARDREGKVADPLSCANWNTWGFSRLALPADFERCLALGEDLHARDDEGNTPLHLAVRADSLAAVTFLLEAGADPSARNRDGNTPLHLTANSKWTAIVTALLASGADLNAGAGTIGTPLLHAIGNRSYTIAGRRRLRFGMSEPPITALLEAGADINAADSTGATPLLASLDPQRRREALADLPIRLLALGADPNRPDGQGRTPLLLAASVEGPEVIEALLNAGADPQGVRDSSGDPALPGSVSGDASALHAAAASGHPEVVRLLLDAGVDPDVPNAPAPTPLHLAVMESRSNRWAFLDAAPGAPSPMALRALLLLEAGADPNVRTADGDTPLHLAVWLPDSTLVAELVRAGADLAARNNNGETPLHIARARNSLPAVRALLERGADPDARDNSGRIADPPCYWDGGGDRLRGWSFLALSPVESVRGCLENGVRVDRRHEEGATPLAGMVSALGCCADPAAVIREFVAAGADVNARDDEGGTPLHRNLRMSGGQIPAFVQLAVTRALLDAGADPNARDSLGATPLHVAGQRTAAAVSLLAEAGADLDARNNAGQTPLHLALRSDIPQVVQALLRLGADPAIRDDEGNTADPASCERWGSASFFAFASAELVTDCIAAGANVQGADDRFSRPQPLLQAAAHAPDPAVIHILLQAGADMQARSRRLSYTALHHAAESGTARAARALLEAGADPNAWVTGFSVDWGWGWTPLHLAARSNPDPEVARVLLEAGADIDARGSESYHHGNTPLHYAGSNASAAVAAVLLEAGADVGARSQLGRTPLHEAAANASNATVIELLVAAGADVNALDARGYAPLHSAAFYNPHPEVAAALIAVGADVNQRDPDGYLPAGRNANHRTPLQMALYRGGTRIGGMPTPTRINLPVVEALVRAGAEMERIDASGQTALHLAALWNPAAFPLLLRLGANPNVRDANGDTPFDIALEKRELEGLPEIRQLREAMRPRR